MVFKKFINESKYTKPSLTIVEDFKLESVLDMDKRCPECNTLLNDMGTCPKCDDGEEDNLNELFGINKEPNKHYVLGILRDTSDTLNTSVINREVYKILKDYAKDLRVTKRANDVFEETVDYVYDFDASDKNIKKIKTEIDILPIRKFAFDQTAMASELRPTFKEIVRIMPVRKSALSEDIVEELSNKEKLLRAYPELNFDKETPVVESAEPTAIEEELTNKEKLLLAYPELNFDKEDLVVEELSIKEKLKRAYPELNFDEPVLTEGVGADTTTAIKDTMTQLAKNDKYQWAKTAADIVDAIPDNFADELFDSVKETLANIKLNKSDKDKIVDALGEEVPEESVEDRDTLGAILDAIDIVQWAKNSPKVIKGFVLTALGIFAVIEPTPVVEILMGIVTLLPASVVAKIAAIVGVTGNPAAAAVAVANKLHNFKNEALEYDSDEEMEEGFISAALGALAGRVIADKLTEDHDDEYDDNYDIEDDVELDRRHAALYGGDRMYCDCGRRLSYNEYGSYCPYCEPEDPEEVYN